MKQHAVRVVIDLDVVPPSRPAEDGPTLPRRAAGPIAPIAVVVLMLWLLGGAAPPVRGLTTVLQVRGTTAALTLGPTALFTASSSGALNSRAGLRRHALSDGSLDWAGQVPHGVESLLLAGRASDVLVARSFAEPETTFLDAGTGRVLWRSTDPNAGIVALTDDGALLVIAGGDAGDRLRMADLHTGRTRWSRAFSSVAHMRTDRVDTQSPTRLTVVTVAGRAMVLDLADGRDLATADLGFRFDRSAGGDIAGDGVEASVADGRLYVARRVDGASSLSAYDADLRLLWRVTGAPTGPIEGCGGLLCVADEQGLAALDRSDGTVRWVDPRRRYGYDLDAGRPHVGAARLIAFDRDDASDSVMLDSATGRVLRDLGRTLTIGPLLLRSDTRIPGRTWVSSRGEGDALRTVGSFESSSPYACAALGHYLACPGVTEPTTVWRIP